MQNITNQNVNISFDTPSTLGLLGTHNSLAYRVAEIERHLHSRERWVSSGGVNLTPFVAASGNNVYGAEVAILAAGDTPIIAGMLYYDIHQMFIVDVDHTTTYRMQLVYGTGTFAAALAAGQYTEMLTRANATSSDRSPYAMQMPRVAAGTKMWFRVWNATNLSEMDVFFGIHEYEG